jgi:hypothetical protein
MLGEDLLRVPQRDVGVPDIVGIDHDHGAMPALVQAPGMIDSDSPAQPGLGHGGFQVRVDRTRALLRARATARANEDMNGERPP